MASREKSKGEIVIFRSDGGPEIEVKLQEDSVWLTQNQIAQLFDVKKAAISKHIKNIFQSKELDKKSTVSKMETVRKEGKRLIKRKLIFYNLDLIISVGYRVNSKRATQFRIWATKILKQHLIKGYTINQNRLLNIKENFDELRRTIEFLKNKMNIIEQNVEASSVLQLISDYSRAFSLLEKYDNGMIELTNKGKEEYSLSYEEAKKVIHELKNELKIRKEASDIFGLEINNKLEGIINNLYETFEGKELYPSLEEKSAHLLYFVIKDHPFVDGNKGLHQCCSFTI